jgi:hypothetical protein
MKGETIARFVALRRERDRLMRELDEVKAESARVEDELREQFIEAGVQNVKSSDGATVYIAPEVLASVRADVEPETMRAAFDAAGIGWMVRETVHPSTLRAWIAEQRKTANEIPPEVAGVINLCEQHRVRVRLDGRAKNGE